jgi:hypothetical protein
MTFLQVNRFHFRVEKKPYLEMCYVMLINGDVTYVTSRNLFGNFTSS